MPPRLPSHPAAAAKTTHHHLGHTTPASTVSLPSSLQKFATVLLVVFSVLGGAILQVFLNPPAVVTIDAAANPAAFGWCAALHNCPVWQLTWQLSCVITFCLVFLSIFACARAYVDRTSNIYLAHAGTCIVCSFSATGVAVLSMVFLSFSKAACIATCALLASLLLSITLIGPLGEALAFSLDDLLLGPLLWKAAASGCQALVVVGRTRFLGWMCPRHEEPTRWQSRLLPFQRWASAW